MLPAFLITFREVIEASFIVATILGILVKLKQRKGVRTVWLAVGAAALLSILLLGMGSLVGFEVQKIYTGKTEKFIEGLFMVISALFITWAVFFLHKHFSVHKKHLLQKIKGTAVKEEQRGLFILVFTAVFREGFEIALFLSTVYFSSKPDEILTGFGGGLAVGLLLSLIIFGATLRMPVYYAFRITNILLILFGAGLLVRGVHEFAEAGIIPELTKITLPFIPQAGSFTADMMKAIFGITHKMDLIQLSLYSLYTAAMVWYVFFRSSNQPAIEEVEDET